jgi:hypothetical protein
MNNRLNHLQQTLGRLDLELDPSPLRIPTKQILQSPKNGNTKIGKSDIHVTAKRLRFILTRITARSIVFMRKRSFGKINDLTVFSQQWTTILLPCKWLPG